VRVLVADDDESQRILYGSLVLGLPGVTSVVAAQDGVEAVRVAGALALHVAILDLNMPRLDGVEAALRLSATQPSLRIALHSSDPDELRQTGARARPAALRQARGRPVGRVGRRRGDALERHPRRRERLRIDADRALT
jgi:CheY-like chemotaxis protein